MGNIIEDKKPGELFHVNRPDGKWRVETANTNNLSDRDKFGLATVGQNWASLWLDNSRYVPRTTATAMYISSESANDTAAGTGAQEVEVYMMDEDLNTVDEFVVALNGQTQVQLPGGNYRFVHRAHIEATGSSGENEGNIWVGELGATAGVPAVKHALIPRETTGGGLGLGQTQQGFTFIPNGFTGRIRRPWITAAANKLLEVRMVIRKPGQGYRCIGPFETFSGLPPDLDVGITVESGTFIDILCRTDAGTVSLSGGYLIDLYKDR